MAGIPQTPAGLKYSCSDCAPYPARHFDHWLDDVMDLAVAPIFEPFLPRDAAARSARFIYKILIAIGLVRVKKNFPLAKVSGRTAVFIEAARRRGIPVGAFRSPFGYLNYFRMKIGGKRFDFEGLPRAEFLSDPKLLRAIDDKWMVKKILARHGLPVPEGRAFWWFQKEKALSYAEKVGYPVIVKPRRGSLTQHVYYNIESGKALRNSLERVVRYSPTFLVERFIPHEKLYRATVVDGEHVFVSKRSPPVVTGDGAHTIYELAERIEFPVGSINTRKLREQGFHLEAVPPQGKEVQLHEKIVLALGARVEEVPVGRIHHDNLELFRIIATLFTSRLLCIDFLAEDIVESWRKQKTAVIELNSLPNIQMHSVSHGDATPTNAAAEAIVNMVLKYYH